eukprot:TRINITY_DN2426_c0_g2_i4.p2 TRINITY_DN2426_c0_g2~~TRINITY_DN2426_c0_g2_i4.p2  ORF type:complete len:201 (+),score=30.93 TRINITY_DN2426_c0_g2_i4:49-651(+)
MTGICIEIPDLPVIQITTSAEANFLDFNREAEDLDSDWLMQPVAENDYDSETQCLVDTKDGKEASFADHYVTKRKKRTKKGKKKEDTAAAPEEDQKRKPGQIGPRSTLAPLMKHDTLDVPGMGTAKGVLSNPATRRIACGALPPELRVERNAPVTQIAQGPPPSYEESTKVHGTPPNTFASAKRTSPPTAEIVPPPRDGL